MIINTGSRTDIPAYFSEWFYNRIKEGFACVRNPYFPEQVTRYSLAPDKAEILSFCSKNPAPMLPRLSELSAYSQVWHVTITPYGKDIEPFVPEKEEVMETFRRLSKIVGPRAVSWRYDPVLLTEKYDIEFHKEKFAHMACLLRGSTHDCIVSFLDLYEKTIRNFPQARPVTPAKQSELIDVFDSAAAENEMHIHLCLESRSLVRAHTDADGCFGKKRIEEAVGFRLSVPAHTPARNGCSCLLGADIGAYNTCGHGCLYCYANYDRKLVEENMKLHDPASPFLIGHAMEGDIVKEAKQVPWRDAQMSLWDL